MNTLLRSSEGQTASLSHTKPTPVEKLHDKAIEGLIRRARGFTSREVKTTYEIDPMGERVVKNEVVTRKQNPPDLQAIIFALTNLDGAKWRAKPEQGSATSDIFSEQADLSSLKDEALRMLSENYPQQ